jgi:hypothetical protein
MGTVNDLPLWMRDAVNREFPGERILWAGRPSATRTFLVSLLIWLFAIPWTAFSLGWVWMAFGGWRSGKLPKDGMETIFGVVVPLFGLPFVLVGLGLMALPFLAWLSARRTAHVVSDNRLVTLRIGRKLKVKSYVLAAVARTERTEWRDGSGTLKVVAGYFRDSEDCTKEQIEMLYGIPEVRKVERLLMAQMVRDRRAV